jgi:hypothetical protein
MNGCSGNNWLRREAALECDYIWILGVYLPPNATLNKTTTLVFIMVLNM